VVGGAVVGVVVVLDWPPWSPWSPYRHDLPHVQPLCDCQETPTADASTRPGVPPGPSPSQAIDPPSVKRAMITTRSFVVVCTCASLCGVAECSAGARPSPSEVLIDTPGPPRLGSLKTLTTLRGYFVYPPQTFPWPGRTAAEKGVARLEFGSHRHQGSARTTQGWGPPTSGVVPPPACS
jgi:hypothetical protein